MKKYPSMFGVLAALLLVASFIVPGNLITPSPVEADPAVCAWDALSTPRGTHPLWPSSDIIDMSVSGSNIALVARSTGTLLGVAQTTNALFISTTSGMSFTTGAWANWRVEWARVFGTTPSWAGHNVYLVAIAPDNPNVIAIVTDNSTATGPREVWITTNGGGRWEIPT